MPFFRVNCPHCQRPTLLGANGQRLNVLNDGTTCSYAMPIQYGHGNAKYRCKYEKHTTPPKFGAMTSGIHSWTFASGDYSQFQEFVMESGSVHLDPANNYQFLWTTPRGADPVASVFYASNGSVVSATGVLMRLNSKPQNYHHFYSNYEAHFQHVADGPGLIIEAPTAAHPDFRLYRDERKPENLLFTYDPIAQSGQRIVPLASGIRGI